MTLADTWYGKNQNRTGTVACHMPVTVPKKKRYSIAIQSNPYSFKQLSLCL